MTHIKHSVEEFERIKSQLYEPQILYSHMNSDPDFNQRLSQIYELIEISSKYEGYVCGEFVRNIIVPNFFEQKIRGYNNVDIWFQTDEKKAKFIREVRTILNGINIIVSETYPENVNQLGYSSIEGFKSFGIEPIDELMKSIFRKL